MKNNYELTIILQNSHNSVYIKTTAPSIQLLQWSYFKVKLQLCVSGKCELVMALDILNCLSLGTL